SLNYGGYWTTESAKVEKKTLKHKSVIFDATVKKEIEAHSNKTLLWPAG
ncbi:unnamed protein product, partial [Caenorhabditis auriculariae]